MSKETLSMEIITLICLIVALIGILVTIHIFQSKRRDKRIIQFIDSFFKFYKGAGVILECLIPAGINTLNNDKEINEALEMLRQRLNGTHPLRNWKDEAEKIGYKKFFNYLINNKIDLNTLTIDVALNNIKNNE